MWYWTISAITQNHSLFKREQQQRFMCYVIINPLRRSNNAISFLFISRISQCELSAWLQSPSNRFSIPYEPRRIETKSRGLAGWLWNWEHMRWPHRLLIHNSRFTQRPADERDKLVGLWWWRPSVCVCATCIHEIINKNVLERQRIKSYSKQEFHLTIWYSVSKRDQFQFHTYTEKDECSECRQIQEEVWCVAQWLTCSVAHIVKSLYLRASCVSNPCELSGIECIPTHTYSMRLVPCAGVCVYF